MKFSDSPIPPASPVAASPAGSPVATSRASFAPVTPVKKTPVRRTRKAKEPEVLEATAAPKAATAPAATEILCKEDAELHLFDIASNTFLMQDQEVTAIVSEVGQWQCTLTCSWKLPNTSITNA
jgi:hypothetical protein